MAFGDINVDLELLIGADAFWSRAQLDVADARQRVLVQAMSFRRRLPPACAARRVRSARA